MEYLGDKLKDNKNARELISIIQGSGKHYPDIVDSFQKQLKTKRTISKRQFEILLEMSKHHQ